MNEKPCIADHIIPFYEELLEIVQREEKAVRLGDIALLEDLAVHRGGVLERIEESSGKAARPLGHTDSLALKTLIKQIIEINETNRKGLEKLRNESEESLVKLHGARRVHKAYHSNRMPKSR